jgi:hypothetical protein
MHLYIYKYGGEKYWEVHKYPLLNTPLSHVVTKRKEVWSNERVVPAYSYELAGWFWEFPNEFGKFRKGFRKKMKVSGNGPIRTKKCRHIGKLP